MVMEVESFGGVFVAAFFLKNDSLSEMDVSENRGISPQIIHLFIGFSIIFTIHFGCFPLFFGSTPKYHCEKDGRLKNRPTGFL